MADESESALDTARAELYGADLEDFTVVGRRLSTAAKKNGNARGPRLIAGLRKPTRGAWTVNQLARTAAADLGELFDVGDALLAAQTSLDGAQLRTLSSRRRQVVDALVDGALRATEQAGASEAVRAEVRSTLEAAMADPDVRADVRAGVLVRAAQFTGFGASAPILSLVPDRTVPGSTVSDRTGPDKSVSKGSVSGATESQPRATTSGSGRSAASRGSEPAQQQAQQRAAQAESRRAAARAQAQLREQERAEARRAQARADAAAADVALAQAVQAEKDAGRGVRLAQEQLADARRRLDDARLDVRQARNQQAKAVRALRE